MANDHAAPPLPQPQPPDNAAHALSHAAQAAASSWSKSMAPMQHNRAVRQLCSALRSTGLATWGLASYQTTDSTGPRPAVNGFTREVLTAARSMLYACECLEYALSAERPGLPDAGEPGTVLCRAAWQTIRSWRHPKGTTADRDHITGQLTTATEALAQAAHNLSFQAHELCGERLSAARSHLSEAACYLTKARHTPSPDPCSPKSAPARPEAAGGTP